MKRAFCLVLLLATPTVAETLLPKEAFIDLHAFTSEIDKMDCTDDASLLKESENEVNPSTLCPKTVERLALNPLGDFGTNTDSMSGYLEDYYYKPLAYSMIRRSNVGDLLSDLIFLDPKLFVLHGQPLQDRYAIFRDGIKQTFGDLTDKMPDLQNNREVANQLVIDIIKKFHVYWNTLRFKGEFDRIKDDTKNVMAEIMDTYKDKFNFVSEVTRVLFEKLKEAYFRFLRAHKMIDVLNKDAARILAEHIVKRYNGVAEKIQQSHTAPTTIVKELHFILRTVECFHIVNYKNGLSEPASISKFNTDIFIRIQMEYETFKAVLAAHDPASLRKVRDFTAQLLLKCRHVIFVTFYYHHISELVNYAPQYFEFDFKRLSKVYHETLDHLMMLPKTCVNFLALKNCAQHEANKVIRYIGVKYSLRRSTSGWEIFDYMKMMIHLLFRSVTPLAYSNWSVFKQVYYQNLFAVMKNFQNHFMLREDEALDELEGLIGSAVERFKQEHEHDVNDFGVVALLERAVYKELLDLKGEYNHQEPLDRDQNALTNIQKTFQNFMHEFLERHRKQMNPTTITIVKVVEDTVSSWVTYTLNKNVTSIQVSNLVSPYVTNMATATFTHLSPTEAAQGVPPGLLVHPPLMITKDYSLPTTPHDVFEHAPAAVAAAAVSAPHSVEEVAGKVIVDHMTKVPMNTPVVHDAIHEDNSVDGVQHRSV